jgi:hypothetical protein
VFDASQVLLIWAKMEDIKRLFHMQLQKLTNISPNLLCLPQQPEGSSSKSALSTSSSYVYSGSKTFSPFYVQQQQQQQYQQQHLPQSVSQMQSIPPHQRLYLPKHHHHQQQQQQQMNNSRITYPHLQYFPLNSFPYFINQHTTQQ